MFCRRIVKSNPNKQQHKPPRILKRFIRVTYALSQTYIKAKCLTPKPKYTFPSMGSVGSSAPQRALLLLREPVFCGQNSVDRCCMRWKRRLRPLFLPSLGQELIKNPSVISKTVIISRTWPNQMKSLVQTTSQSPTTGLPFPSSHSTDGIDQSDWLFQGYADRYECRLIGRSRVKELWSHICRKMKMKTLVTRYCTLCGAKD